MVEAIHTETQFLDRETGASVHKNLGMFVLVVMSHGDFGTILGSDDIFFRLVDIYRMLSSENFPSMHGKPKLIILQSCSEQGTVPWI